VFNNCEVFDMFRFKIIRAPIWVLVCVIGFSFLVHFSTHAQDLDCVCKEKEKNENGIVLECVCNPLNDNNPGNNVNKPGNNQGQVAKGKRLTGGPLKGAQLLNDPAAAALEQDRPGAPWITKWYAPAGIYTNNGGFQQSGRIDLIEKGTNKRLTQPKLATAAGLLKTQNTKLNWGKKNGGTCDWKIIEITPNNGNNMGENYGGGDQSNFDTYAILVIQAPSKLKAVMSTAHDDWAQVWINGEKWYNNSKWTGGALKVSYDVEVELNRGGNVLLYRCGESGGSDYFNLHFDDITNRKVKYYPNNAKTKNGFFVEVNRALRGLAIEPVDKLPVTWSEIKR